MNDETLHFARYHSLNDIWLHLSQCAIKKWSQKESTSSRLFNCPKWCINSFSWNYNNYWKCHSDRNHTPNKSKTGWILKKKEKQSEVEQIVSVYLHIEYDDRDTHFDCKRWHEHNEGVGEKFSCRNECTYREACRPKGENTSNILIGYHQYVASSVT